MVNYLVGVLECPPVDTVVGSVETALREPDNIAVYEAACTDCLEGPVPMKHFTRSLTQDECIG